MFSNQKSLARLAALVVAMLLVSGIIFSGCAPKQAENAPQATEKASQTAAAEQTSKSLEPQKMALWSHWADEASKKDFVQSVVDQFINKNPNFEVEVVWYQKDKLITALTTSLQAGTGPDIFYTDPQNLGIFPPFANSGFMYDLAKYIESNIEPWTLTYVKMNDILYALPLETNVTALYYNKSVLEKAGVAVTEGKPFEMGELKDAVKKIKDAGFTPFAAGIMDRPNYSSILLQSILLRFTGAEKWADLGTGKLAWTDPDVTAGVKFTEDLIKMGAYPKGVAAIKLGESHGLFFSGEHGFFPLKSFFSGRAFVPVEKGGMAEDFPLGIMDYPTLKDGKANDMVASAVAGSYGVNAASKNVEKAAELLQIMSQPDNANVWMEKTKGLTGLKADWTKITDPYFVQLRKAVIDGKKMITGPMELGADPAYRDAFYQLSTAFVAGSLSGDDMIKQLEDARAKVQK